MDENMKWLYKSKVNEIISNLEKNNMQGFYVENKEELIKKLDELVKNNSTVSVGGSMTLFETGVIDYLKNKDVLFYNRYEEGLSKDDIKDIYRKSFSVDYYFTSTQAITLQGELYNVDGTGNRVAAMLYGPENVIVIVGINKIVDDFDAAIKRNRNISAPANAKRLNRKTPCAKTGYCMECNSNDRICNEYTLIKRQSQKDRIKVIIVAEEFGY
ncbi:lactate utilization protein [Peptostreptococcaceae bacterium AGR-M142]